MQCTERKTARTRLLGPFAAVALTAGALLLLVPAAEAQMNPPQARPQAQSPQTPSLQTPSPSVSISDEKLTAAAAAIRQVATIQQSYESKIAAVPFDKHRLSKEANDAVEKAVTDQGLSVDEFNTIIITAQNDPTVREKLIQRIPHPSH